MIRFSLDTNTVIALLKSPVSPVAERLRRHSPDEIAISAIVSFELYFGAFRSSRRPENVGRLDRMAFHVLPLDIDDARHAGEIRAILAQRGTPIGPYDLLIAGQARARRLTLVSNNTREFSRVPDLAVTDWTAVGA